MAVDAGSPHGKLSDVGVGGPDAGEASEPETAARTGPERAESLAALVAGGLLTVGTLAGVLGWLSYGAYQSYRADQQRLAFVQVARQAALNLTTIDYTHVEADVARILDSSTGGFRDDFQRRSQPFIEVVKKAQSKSEGTIAEAALESLHGNDAQVLVAVQVTTSLPGVADQPTKGWRMRVDLRKAGPDIKVSNVAFVT